MRFILLMQFFLILFNRISLYIKVIYILLVVAKTYIMILELMAVNAVHLVKYFQLL